MLKIAFAALAAMPLTACVTTPADPAKELAYCEQMERQMGTDHQHSHAEAKGQGINPMNVTHARCRQMLGIS